MGLASPSTTTTVVSSQNPSNYGQPVTFTATVAASFVPTGAGSPSGTVSFFDGTSGNSPVICSGAAVSGSGTTVTATCTTNTLTVGNHTITAVYSGDSIYPSSSGTTGQTVNKAPLTVTANNQSMTYGSAVPVLTYTVTGFVLGDTSGVLSGAPSLSTTATSSSTVGNYPISISQGTLTAPSYYALSFAPGTLTINQATPTVNVIDNGGTYNGNPFPATATVTGVSGTAGSTLENVGLTLTYYSGSTATGTPLSGAPVNAGTYTVVASFAGSTDYTSASAQTTFTIAKANANITVTPYSVTYDGNAHTATGTATGVESPTPANLTSLLNLSGTTHTTAGTYTDTWTFAGNNNYNSASGTVTDIIAKATPTVSVSDAGGTYNGNPFPATDSITGVSGVAGSSLEGTGLTLTYYSGSTATGTPLSGAPVHAGTYTVVASFAGNTDYNSTSAQITFTVNPYAFTYQIGNDSHVYGSTDNLAADLGTTINTGVNGENLSIAYSSTGDTATAHVVGSPYAITGTLSNGTGQLSDYSVTLKNGSLTVNPYAFTYQIGNDSQTYGSPANLAADLPGTVGTGVNGENLSIAYASTGDTATAHVVGSPYAITGTLSNGTGQLSDYSVTLKNGQLTVNPYAFTYQIGNDSHLYGVTDNLAADLGTTINTGVNGENLSIAYSSTGNVATAAVGTYAITGTLSNGTGQLSDYSVTLKNGALTVNPRASSTGVSLAVSTINEGSSTTVTITVSDNSGGTTNGVTPAGVNVIPSGTITLSLSGTNNVGQSDLTLSASSCTLTANANGTATCTVTVNGLDNNGGTISASYAGDATHTGSSGSAALAVLNVAPTVGAITAPITPQNITTAINTSANFTDPGILDTHTAVWNWGDNTTSTGVVTESNGSGSVTGSHVYSTDGVYTITLTVTDKDGGVGTSVFQYVVIYNPNAGFVTGGGWIVSATGALVSSPSLTGRANFGFVSKYLPGRSTPDGQTEFQFQLGNFNFHSTSYDWLTIINNMAQYQGNGTINGSGNCKFVLTGVDGDLLGGTGPDTFRIRIWDPNANPSGNGSNYVYDNYPSGSLYNDPSGTPLSGGEIQIHKANQTAAGGQGHHLGLAPLTAEQLQPIWTAALARWQAAGATAEQLSPLAHYTVQIVNVPSGVLAMTGPGIIWISPDAAGHGWFIDPAPLSALAGRPAPNRMDLLSVVAHEMGHVILNMDESAALNDVMTEALPEGVRRLPTPADLGKTEVVAAPVVDNSLAVVPAALTTDSLTDTVLNPANDVRADNSLDSALLSLALNQALNASTQQVPAVSSAATLLDNVLSQFRGISLDDGVLDDLIR